MKRNTRYNYRNLRKILDSLSPQQWSLFGLCTSELSISVAATQPTNINTTLLDTHLQKHEVHSWKFTHLQTWSTTVTTTVLRPFFWDHPGEPVPEENFWTLWCKGRLTKADTLTIRLSATPSGLTSAYLHHHPIFFTGQMPFLPPNQQHQSTEGN